MIDEQGVGSVSPSVGFECLTIDCAVKEIYFGQKHLVTLDILPFKTWLTEFARVQDREDSS